MNFQKKEQTEFDSYNFDEYIDEMDRFIIKLKNAIEKDSEDNKRVNVLISPLYKEYRKIHGYSDNTLITNNKAYSFFLHETSKLLENLENYIEYLRENKNTANEIIVKIKKSKN